MSLFNARRILFFVLVVPGMLMIGIGCTQQFPVYLTDVEVVSASEHAVNFLNRGPAGDFWVWVEVHALGDWNGDGIEDMVLEVTQRAKHGTYRARHYTVLTRDEDQSWEVLGQVSPR